MNAAKLILRPPLTWWLAACVFDLPPMLAGIAVLPAGTGPFRLAGHYRREATATSHTILLSTFASLLSLPAIPAWLRHGG